MCLEIVFSDADAILFFCKRGSGKDIVLRSTIICRLVKVSSGMDVTNKRPFLREILIQKSRWVAKLPRNGRLSPDQGYRMFGYASDMPRPGQLFIFSSINLTTTITTTTTTTSSSSIGRDVCQNDKNGFAPEGQNRCIYFEVVPARFGRLNWANGAIPFPARTVVRVITITIPIHPGFCWHAGIMECGCGFPLLRRMHLVKHATDGCSSMLIALWAGTGSTGRCVVVPRLNESAFLNEQDKRLPVRTCTVELNSDR